MASRQRSIDEQLSYGDIYRIGSAVAICVSRTEEAFVSDADNDPIANGTDIQAVFEIIRLASSRPTTSTKSSGQAVAARHQRRI